MQSDGERPTAPSVGGPFAGVSGCAESTWFYKKVDKNKTTAHASKGVPTHSQMVNAPEPVDRQG